MSLTPSTFYAFWMYGRRRSKVTFTTQSFELHHQCNNNKHTVIMKLLLFRHLGIKSTWLVFGRDHGWRNISQLMSRRPKWHKLSNIHKCDIFKFDCIWPNFLATYTTPSDIYFIYDICCMKWHERYNMNDYSKVCAIQHDQAGLLECKVSQVRNGTPCSEPLRHLSLITGTIYTSSHLTGTSVFHGNRMLILFLRGVLFIHDSKLIGETC